jgi:hypothetical protein
VKVGHAPARSHTRTVSHRARPQPKAKKQLPGPFDTSPPAHGKSK